MATLVEYGIVTALTATGVYIAYKAGWLPTSTKKTEQTNPAQQQAQQAVAGVNINQSPPTDSFVRTTPA